MIVAGDKLVGPVIDAIGLGGGMIGLRQAKSMAASRNPSARVCRSESR